VLGLIDPDVYGRETENWALQAKGQDVGNLIAVVSLIGACWAYVRGSRAAGSVWLGTLFYVVYAFLVYAVAVHLNRLFLVYVAVLGLSVYAVLRHCDALRASTPSEGRGTRLAAFTLIGTGTVFALLWLSEIVPALVTGEPPQSLVEAGLAVNPIHALDLAVVLPGFVLTGLGLLRGRSNGRFLGGPWLVFSVLMAASIVAAMTLIVAGGDRAALPPLVFVSGTMLVSLYAAYRHLRTAATP
jgi:hypothetical protein